jgi:tetratricopeptide (TPR) repeat protein
MTAEAEAMRLVGDASATAAEALRLVGDDPARAVRVADVLIRGTLEPLTVSAAWRARGLAHRELGELDIALTDLWESVRIADAVEPAGPARQAAGEARMSLVSVLAERGEMGAALDESDRALGLLSGLPAARMRVQRGTFYGRVGRFADAIAEYERALPVLRRDGDQLWEARVLNNVSIARAYRGEFAGAAADLRRAEELFLAVGQPLDAADACWNRGFVAARLGDVPLALTHFDTAEARFAAHGVPVPEIFLGRCEVLLSVGLHAEALANAERALDATAGTRSSLWAEAHLALAQAALAVGDHGRARTAAGQAVDLFEQQQRPPWATVARYVQLRCAEDEGEVSATAVLAAISTNWAAAAGPCTSWTPGSSPPGAPWAGATPRAAGSSSSGRARPSRARR